MHLGCCQGACQHISIVMTGGAQFQPMYEVFCNICLMFTMYIPATVITAACVADTNIISGAYQEEGISVEQHVLRRDGGCQVVWALSHKVCCILCGDVLHDNSQLWYLLHDWFQFLLNEDFLTIKEVH